jgi:hypothetical protein
MKLKHFSNWPPEWHPALVPSTKASLSGEIGVLKSATAMDSNNLLLLTMQFEGVDYVGILQVSGGMRDKVLATLPVHKGRSIKEIGELLF